MLRLNVIANTRKLVLKETSQSQARSDGPGTFVGHLRHRIEKTRSDNPSGRRLGERKVRITQRERIVSSSASGNEVKSRSSDPLGGSSRVLRNALADCGIMRSASAITPNLSLPVVERIRSSSSSARICSTKIRRDLGPG